MTREGVRLVKVAWPDKVHKDARFAHNPFGLYEIQPGAHWRELGETIN